MNNISNEHDTKQDSFVEYDLFAKLNLKIGTIEEVEEIPKSKKLLKLKVRVGKDEVRTLVAGIKKQYSKETLIGSQIVILTNLEPRKVFGVLSHGMLLAADAGGEAILLRPDHDVPNGTKVR